MPSLLILMRAVKKPQIFKFLLLNSLQASNYKPLLMSFFYAPAHYFLIFLIFFERRSKSLMAHFISVYFYNLGTEDQLLPMEP